MTKPHPEAAHSLIAACGRELKTETFSFDNMACYNFLLLSLLLFASYVAGIEGNKRFYARVLQKSDLASFLFHSTFITNF